MRNFLSCWIFCWINLSLLSTISPAFPEEPKEVPLPDEVPLKKDTPRLKEDIILKIYPESYENVWKAVLNETKHYEYAFMDESTGLLKTRWLDNTEDEQFFTTDSQESQAILASQVQFLIGVKRGYWKGRDATRVSIYKKHRIIPARPFEDELKLMTHTPNKEWVRVPTDGVLEGTLHYRIGRLLSLNTYLNEGTVTVDKYPFP